MPLASPLEGGGRRINISFSSPDVQNPWQIVVSLRVRVDVTEEISVGQGRSGRAKSSGFGSGRSPYRTSCFAFPNDSGRVVSPTVRCPPSGGKQEFKKSFAFRCRSCRTQREDDFLFLSFDFKEDYWLGRAFFAVVFDSWISFLVLPSARPELMF